MERVAHYHRHRGGWPCEKRRPHPDLATMEYKQTNKSSYSFIIHSLQNKYSSEASFISFSYVLFSEVSLRYSKSIT